MKKKNIIYGALASFAFLLSSCSSDDVVPVNESGNGQIKVRLSGSAKTVGGVPVTKAGSVAGSPEESNVDALLAVAFNDLAASASMSGGASTEDDGDTFYKIIEIPVTEDSPSELSFGLGMEGDFQICFIANANETLKNKLGEVLTSSSNTVKDLKDFVMTTDDGSTSIQAPDSKEGGMLMVSPFYSVKSSFSSSAAQELSVNLTRLMARMDIVNACDGINIQKVIFKNRAIGTKLFDFEVKQPEKTLETNAKEYDMTALVTDSDGKGLVGNSSKAAEYKEGIYTYSQFGKEKGGSDGATDERPSVEVQYKMPSVAGDKTYTYTLYFKEAEGDAEKPLKNNYLYTLKISNANNNIRFTLDVADWNEGKTIEVGVDQIIDGITGDVIQSGVNNPGVWGNGGEENITAQ
ncbi:MAG: hypothetical protein SOR57_00555 [Parabacteroides sp.]|nr:hypothetical protein [Parabacteroides sp.]